MEAKQWIVGLLFAVIAGGIVTPLFLYVVRGLLGLGPKPEEKIKRIPPWLTGFVERLVFAILVGLDVSGATTAMMGGLAIKLAANWNRKDMESIAQARPFTFTALLAGLVSLMFAALGGMIASGKLWSVYVAYI